MAKLEAASQLMLLLFTEIPLKQSKRLKAEAMTNGLTYKYILPAIRSTPNRVAIKLMTVKANVSVPYMAIWRRGG